MARYIPFRIEWVIPLRIRGYNEVHVSFLSTKKWVLPPLPSRNGDGASLSRRAGSSFSIPTPLISQKACPYLSDPARLLCQGPKIDCAVFPLSGRREFSMSEDKPKEAVECPFCRKTSKRKSILVLTDRKQAGIGSKREQAAPPSTTLLEREPSVRDSQLVIHH